MYRENNIFERIRSIEEDMKFVARCVQLMERKNYLQEGEVHYLYAGEWFNDLPEGAKVYGLFGEVYEFNAETSDDDIRFGCLPYGFIRKEKDGQVLSIREI